MSLPIEKWARQAVDLEYVGRPDKIVASTAVLDDVRDLAMLHKATWKRRERRMAEEGFPTMMAEGTYGALMAYPNPATITTTSISGTVNLWPQLIYTPIPVNGMLAPQAFRIIVCAKITTVATPGNFGLVPTIGATGAWTTGGTAVAGGASLGASGNVALTASITNAFYYVIGDITIRSVGAPGANSTAVGMFHLNSTQNTAAGVAGPAPATAAYSLLFGGTNASFDTTIAGGISFGAVHTVTTITHNVEQLHGCDWNVREPDEDHEYDAVKTHHHNPFGDPWDAGR